MQPLSVAGVRGLVVFGSALALLSGLAAPVRSADPATVGKEALAWIAAAEAKPAWGRLSLGIREHRGKYKEGESLGDLTKRLSGEKALEAEGSFVFGPDGWLKDLTVPGAAGKQATHTRTAEGGGTLRILVEATVQGQPQKLGRVSRISVTAPADAILSRRVGKSLMGVAWNVAQPEGDLLRLQGTRGTERHAVILRRLSVEPLAYEVRSWDLTRFLVGPQGDSLEQTTSCVVTPGPAPGGVAKVEEWVINRPPLANVAHRVTEVRKAEELPSLPAEELTLRFPPGALVTDTRGEVPVEYEQTADGIRDEDVARAADRFARGRAKAGDPAPPFDLKDLKGKSVRLADYRGKVLVLFWFSNRSTKGEEAAGFVRELYEGYKGKGVQVLALGIGDEGDVEKKAEEYRKRVRWAFPVVIDPGDAMRRYGLEAGIPKIAIVDGTGILAYARAGIDPDEVAAALDRLVGAKGKEKP